MSKPKDFTGKAPVYQKWDEKAFQFDTMHMGWQSRLLYKDLLQKAFHISTRPDLPSDDTQLCNMLGIPSEVWDEHKIIIRTMFTLDAEKGILWQKRLRNDWQDLYIYRREQKKRADARWAPAKSLKLQPVDATALPTQSHGNASRAEQSKSEENSSKSHRTDDAVPSASLGPDDNAVSPSANLGYVTPPGGNSTATPKPPLAPADKKNLCDELTAFVFAKTGFQPPSPKSVRDLIDQYPISVIQSALLDAIWEKPKGELLAKVRLFFQGGAAGIILQAKQREFLENLKSWVDDPLRLVEDDYTFEDFVKEDRPAGIEDYVILDAKKKITQFLKSRSMQS